MGSECRVLIVEDNADDCALVVEELRRAGYRVTHERVETREAMRAALVGQPWDVILCDYALPHFSAPAALALYRDLGPDIPFIVVSGQVGEEAAVALMKAGAHDFVMKQHLARLVPAVARERRDAREREARRQAERALRHSEERYRQLFATETDALVLFDAETQQFLDANDAALEMYGCTRHELLRMAYPDVMAVQEEAAASIAELASGGRVRLSVRYHARRDGTAFPVEISASAFALGDRQVVSAAIRDITERRRLERDVLEAVERERQRIGRDLHDGLGTQLSGIAFMAKALAKSLADQGLPQALEASEIARLLAEAVRQTRALARNISPVGLEAGDLVAALRELTANAAEMFDITCELRAEEPRRACDSSISSHLYRIAQEAIANATRHGKAKHVVVTVKGGRSRTLLAIKDDGVGLPDDASQSPGMGLRTMSYRASVLGGRLDFRRQPEGGTLIMCSVPTQPRGGGTAIPTC